MSNKDTELQAVQRATEGFGAKHDFALRQMRNATRKISHLESDISPIRERLPTRVEAIILGVRL